MTIDENAISGIHDQDEQTRQQETQLLMKALQDKALLDRMPGEKKVDAAVTRQLDAQELGEVGTDADAGRDLDAQEKHTTEWFASQIQKGIEEQNRQLREVASERMQQSSSFRDSIVAEQKNGGYGSTSPERQAKHGLTTPERQAKHGLNPTKRLGGVVRRPRRLPKPPSKTPQRVVDPSKPQSLSSFSTSAQPISPVMAAVLSSASTSPVARMANAGNMISQRKPPLAPPPGFSPAARPSTETTYAPPVG